MVEIKFIGEFSGFIFDVDGLACQVSMSALGYTVLQEPDITINYPTWEEFAEKHPEFAATMVQVIKRKMNETFSVIQQWQIQDAMPEVHSKNPKIPAYGHAA